MTFAATHDTSDTLRVTEAVKAELRAFISKWSRFNPERIIITIPASNLQSLGGFDGYSRMVALGQLEGYVGAALPADDSIQSANHPQEHPIAWPYELHPMPISGTVQVLLLSDELKKHPLRRLADEVAHQAENYAQKFTVDEVFRFTVVACVIERIEKMTPLNKANFRATLNRRFAAVGLSAQSGTVYSALEIRRNR